MDTGLIYALTDPTTGVVRYVGKTEQTLEERLVAHKKTVRWPSRRLPIHLWLREQHALGLLDQVKIIALAVVPTAELGRQEKRWIRKLREERIELLNSGLGGGGGDRRSGMKNSEEAKARQRAASLGRRHSEETKKRLSEQARADGRVRRLQDPEVQRRAWENATTTKRSRKTS